MTRYEDLGEILCEPCMPVGADEEDGEEGAGQRRLPCPRSPTQQEKEEHEVSHMPYRSWCEACVRGRGRADRRPRGVAEEERDPMVSWIAEWAAVQHRRSRVGPYGLT